MTISSNTFCANLFYSYSHKDAQYRDDMEIALSLLKRSKLLKDWSDLNILPGQTIPKEVRQKMDDANILVFLLSQDFIASDECMKEWEYAKQLTAKGKPIFRIPIILRDCPWEDLLANDNIKALPNDAKSVANFDNKDTAWMQVYHGIKAVISQLRKTFTSELEISAKMKKINNLSTSPTVEDDPSEFALLVPEDGIQYFFPLKDVRRDSSEMSLELLPESPEEVAFLRSLQDKLGNRFASSINLACAYREYASWVTPRNIVETSSHWEILFGPDTRRHNYNFFDEATVNGIPPDEIAKMRARRILLDEKLENVNPPLGQNDVFSQSMIEDYIRGMPSSSREPQLQVPASPIPGVYRQLGQIPERFKKFARLISILYLKLSNTVENVLLLDLELIRSTQLQVRFKGTRPKFYSNVPPSTIEFEGICSLSG